MPLRPSIYSLAPVLVAAALAGCGGKPPPRPAQTPEAGYVVMQAQPAPLSTELPGRTSPFAISEVRPQVGGIIQKRLFTEGSNVKKDQLLYRIDPAPYKAALDQSKAQLASVEANLVTAKAKADRYRDLVKIKAVAQQDYDDAQATYLQAVASAPSVRVEMPARPEIGERMSV